MGEKIMVEKILILLGDVEQAQDLKETLKRWAVDVVDTLSEERNIPFGELSVRYNMIIISKRFCGRSYETAKVVRRIRREFFDPMIALDTDYGSDDLFPLQVAGCNFILKLGDWDNVRDQVCKAVAAIEPLLKSS